MTNVGAAILVIVVLGFLGLIPLPCGAWSVEGHQIITRNSIGLLPKPWQEFFRYYDWFLAEAVSYPDVYYRAMDPNEAPRHYVDLEVWNANTPSTGTLP
jgi:hypothetical protein